jgi:hypothetical protein
MSNEQPLEPEIFVDSLELTDKNLAFRYGDVWHLVPVIDGVMDIIKLDIEVSRILAQEYDKVALRMRLSGK